MMVARLVNTTLTSQYLTVYIANCLMYLAFLAYVLVLPHPPPPPAGWQTDARGWYIISLIQPQGASTHQKNFAKKFSASSGRSWPKKWDQYNRHVFPFFLGIKTGCGLAADVGCWAKGEPCETHPTYPPTFIQISLDGLACPADVHIPVSGAPA